MISRPHPRSAIAGTAAREPELLREEQVDEALVLLVGGVDAAFEQRGGDADDDVQLSERRYRGSDGVVASIRACDRAVLGDRGTARGTNLGNGRVGRTRALTDSVLAGAQVVDDHAFVARARAHALPMPLPAPVTNAVRPSSLPVMLSPAVGIAPGRRRRSSRRRHSWRSNCRWQCTCRPPRCRWSRRRRTIRRSGRPRPSRTRASASMVSPHAVSATTPGVIRTA